MFVKWDITEKCNLNCIHCKVSGSKNNDNELDFNDIIYMVDKLKRDGVQYIQFIGGEPFCKENFLEILKYCNSKNIGIGITTNGTMMDERIINKLKKDIEVPMYIYFSLDGPNSFTNDQIRGKGVFEKCITSLATLSKYKGDMPNLIIGVNATINKINKDFIDEYIKLSNSYLVDVLGFSYIEEDGNAIENKEKLIISDAEKIEVFDKIFKAYSALEKNFMINMPIKNKVINFFNNKYKCNYPLNKEGNGCMVFRGGVRISSTGSIYPCESRHVIKESIDMKVINEEGAKLQKDRKILELEEIKDFRELITNNLNRYNLLTSNIDCEYRNICLGCPMDIGEITSMCRICNMLGEVPKGDCNENV